MTDAPTAESSSCSGRSRCRVCCIIFAIAHIAILTCISMALWKTAWALEALPSAPG